VKILAWTMLEKRDEKFTKELAKKIIASAKSFGVVDFLIEIKERYLDEEKPHYHFKAKCGANKNRRTGLIAASYSATADGKTYSGRMEIIFKSDAPEIIRRILTAGLLFLYDESIRKYYTEWITEYQTIIYHSK